MGKTYITVQGDMWDSIAHTQLGDASVSGELMRVNPQFLNFFLFPAGCVLELPDLDRRETSASAPPWRRASG